MSGFLCRNSDEFFLVESDERKKFQEFLDHQMQLVNTLEMKNIELENKNKLRERELDFKDRYFHSGSGSLTDGVAQ